MKAFEEYLPNYEHEQQFNNFSFTHHPTKPQFHIDMKKHTARGRLFKEKFGPNPISTEFY